MGTALITIRIMPSSPEINLEEIQKKAEKIILKEHGKNFIFKKEPIAFGLNSLNISFARDENLDNDAMINKIRSIKNISSAEIIDFRRAFG
jgi:elongation factor 1-beta